MMGRPKIEIDFKKLDMLLELHLTTEDCATFFDCSKDSLERRVKKVKKTTFAAYAKQKNLKGKHLLMKKYWEGVHKGNVSLIIFGLKNRCNWHDNIQTSERPRGFGFTSKKK